MPPIIPLRRRREASGLSARNKYGETHRSLVNSLELDLANCHKTGFVSRSASGGNTGNSLHLPWFTIIHYKGIHHREWSKSSLFLHFN